MAPDSPHTDPPGLVRLTSRKRKSSRRQEPPKELDWSQAEYLPLPPPPHVWDLDGRNEYDEASKDPDTGPVFDAWYDREYRQIVEMAGAVPHEKRLGVAGDFIATAYRNVIFDILIRNELETAAHLSMAQFHQAPNHVLSYDYRRFNEILEELDRAGLPHSFFRVAIPCPVLKPPFIVSEQPPWSLEGERILDRQEQPSPHFDLVSMDQTGTWMLDRFGSSDRRERVKSVLRRYDRSGRMVGQRALCHDVYRLGAGLEGSGIAIMDTEGILHVYNEGLSLIIENSLAEDPRVVGYYQTLDASYHDHIKYQVRSVDIAPESDRYLFTLADEAWCCTRDGRTSLSVILPPTEGWVRAVRKTQNSGLTEEVEAALELFGLTLPLRPVDIKKQYRAMALVTHPDRNIHDPLATEKMKNLNTAFEVLTGVDPTTLDFEESDVTYFRQTEPETIFVVNGISVAISFPVGRPQDWIWSSRFSPTHDGIFLSTYSGKIIFVSNDGQARYAYDVGDACCMVYEAGRYTYFSTTTRLYVIEDLTRLAAVLDVYKQGSLLVSRHGFGLRSKRRLQWFTSAGEKLGELTTKDGIEMIIPTDEGALVQTERHQVLVRGLIL